MRRNRVHRDEANRKRTAATALHSSGVRRRGVTINLRATVYVRDLIDRAAALLGQNRSEFMLDSARRRAEDVLLDQRLFVLDRERYERFLNTLDEPPKPIKELKKLLSTKAPWEK